MMINQKGFTLIEIMIVITIMAIMSAVVTMNLGSAGYGRFMSSVYKFQNLFSSRSLETN